MNTSYFSDRERGPRPRIREEIPQGAWGGIVVAIGSRVTDGSFGCRYPLQCEDGEGTCGCDEQQLRLALVSEIPEIEWPLRADQMQPTLVVLDLLEFCFRAVGKPQPYYFHSYWGHSHLSFDAEAGQANFREDINRIFSRNELSYELEDAGSVVRVAQEILRRDLTSTVFQTGDKELDSLLETARIKFLDPESNIRRESLEKLWDAWERLKTIETPVIDKKASVAALLMRVAPEPSFREKLNNEANELTTIGNSFRIRHSETKQVSLQMNEHVDYLFHRLFALIWLCLRTTGRLRFIA